jgi:hypothetical protein
MIITWPSISAHRKIIITIIIKVRDSISFWERERERESLLQLIPKNYCYICVCVYHRPWFLLTPRWWEDTHTHTHKLAELQDWSSSSSYLTSLMLYVLGCDDDQQWWEGVSKWEGFKDKQTLPGGSGEALIPIYTTLWKTLESGLWSLCVWVLHGYSRLLTVHAVNKWTNYLPAN